MPYTPAHNLPDPDFDPESSRPGRELAIEAEASAKVIAALAGAVVLLAASGRRGPVTDRNRGL